MNYSSVSKTAAGLLLIGLLAACGGGGGSPAFIPADTTPSLVGVAASGAPIANATVTLTCGDGSTMTTTSDANGVFSVKLTNCSAPYVLSVTGTVGEAQVTLVSVQATRPAEGSATQVNITPLTHAIAATLASSGDPLDLAANFATEKGGITEAAIKLRKDALTAALADTLTAAGLDATKFDIISSDFRADRTGMDKVLDNVKVEVTTSGVNITNPAGVKVDDMGDKGTTAVAADLSAGSISISKSTNFATPLAKLPAAVDDNSVGDSIRELLNTCFAQPKATRGTFAAPSAACQAVPIASDYLHDGRSGSQEFDRFLTDAKYDSAKFNKPEVIRFFSSTATDTRALIKFTLARADGVVESFTTVGENSTATGGSKKLRGNQRPFKVFVNGFVNKRMQIETRSTTNAKSTFYSTGINLYVGFLEGGAGGSASGTTGVTGRKVDYVKVTGPGLPAAGVFLKPTLAGCDSYYAIAASATATPPNCTSLFRLSSRAASATDTDNYTNTSNGFGSTNPSFAAAKVSDANLIAIQPFSAYKFEVWRTGNATATPSHVFYERLRSRPITMGTVAAKDGEVDKVRWNTLSADTIAAIDPLSGKAFAGGNPSSLTARWTNLPNTAPTYSLQVQSRPAGSGTTLYQEQVFVPFSASSVAFTNGTQGWPNMGSVGATTAGAFNLVQLISRNQFDTQLFTDWFY